MLKKSLTAFAVASLLTVAACGGDASSNSDTGADDVKMGPGVTEDEIRVAVVTDYSGPIAEAAIQGSYGVEVKIKEVNDAGGICGRDVIVEKVDTKYDPQVTTQVYRANSKKILMISQFVGTPGLMAVQGNIERDKMPTLSASLNTGVLELPHVYVTMPVFEVELMNGVAWAAEQAGASASNPLKIGTVTSADETGEIYRDAIRTAAESVEGVEIVAEPTFTNADTDYTAQVSQLKKAGAETVILGVTPANTAGIIGGAAQLGYEPQWVSSSGGWNAALAEPLQGLLDNYFISGGYGTLNDDVRGVQELEAAMKKYEPNAAPDNFQVGGWINGTVTVAALEKACENKDLTREGVAKALEGLEVDLGDITPTINMGNGSQLVSYSSRINKVGADGVQIAVTDFFESDGAKAWAEKKGY